jgi:predicted transposase/invertase (TIGR01784 family)
MPKYLNPKNDFMFKKLFGENKHLCISLLNSLLKFEGDDLIEFIEYDTSELLPDLDARKYTIVDVRCRDKKGREFIVEMQMKWTAEFTDRVLYNACKSFIKQFKRGVNISLTNPVYSLNLVNEIFAKDPDMEKKYYHHYKTLDVERIDKQLKGLEFIFIELPKYKKLNKQENTYFDLWLRFMTDINEKTKEIPIEFFEKEEINYALKCVELASLTEEELMVYDRLEDDLIAGKMLLNGSRKEGIEEGFELGEVKGLEKGRAEGLVEGLEKGREEGLAEGLEKGQAKGILITARNLKKLGIPDHQISAATGLSIEEVKRI